MRFPGTYTFQKNESLKSVFSRAGGLTQSAFPKGAVFTRQNLMEREEEQKERLIAQLETDVANISLAAGSGETAIKAKSVSDSLLTKLKNSKSTGRLVLDLNDQLSKVKIIQLSSGMVTGFMSQAFLLRLALSEKCNSRHLICTIVSLIYKNTSKGAVDSQPMRTKREFLL